MGDELYYENNNTQTNNAFIEERYNDPSPKSPFNTTSSFSADGGNSFDGTISIKSSHSNISSIQSVQRMSRDSTFSAAQPSTLPLPLPPTRIHRQLVSLNDLPLRRGHNRSSSF